jgi:hypothetical protein
MQLGLPDLSQCGGVAVREEGTVTAEQCTPPSPDPLLSPSAKDAGI